jgi:hypothetical protein
MKRLLITAAAALALELASPALAQEIAPGWTATGEWQCMGGRVRIITSQPANGSFGLDFYVIGAWFDNHYTLYKGDALYYNGTPCTAVAYPWPMPRPRPKQTVKLEDCQDYLQDREAAETPEQKAGYNKCLRRNTEKACAKNRNSWDCEAAADNEEANHIK